MNKVRAVLFLVVVFAILPVTSYSTSTGFHERIDGKVCVKCHQKVPDRESNPYKDGNLRFGGDVEKVCMECHSKYRHEHPVKLVISPSIKGNETIPLGKEGRIVCITCHDMMRNMPVHRNVKFTGNELCLNCHVESDIFAQIIWYPTHLNKGETGRLEVKVVEFNAKSTKNHLGDSVLLYFYAKDIDSGSITFGTNVLYDDGSKGDRVGGDSIYTLMEATNVGGNGRRLVYTGWILDKEGKRSNTVNLAIEYEN